MRTMRTVYRNRWGVDMNALADPGRLVTLRGGLVLPAAPVVLALRLEGEGFHFKLDDDGWLMVSPSERLTASDRADLVRWRWHIALLVSYEAPGMGGVVARPGVGSAPCRPS
jgi:hypothetical protein